MQTPGHPPWCEPCFCARVGWAGGPVRQRLQAPIDVMLVSDARSGRVQPSRLRWDGEAQKIVQVGLHHTYRRGRVLYHVFSVVTETLFYRLVLDTDSLTWTVEEISDDRC